MAPVRTLLLIADMGGYTAYMPRDHCPLSQAGPHHDRPEPRPWTQMAPERHRCRLPGLLILVWRRARQPAGQAVRWAITVTARRG